MRLLQLRQKACFSLCIASAFLAVQLVSTAQQTVPFDGGIPVAPAGFEPLPIPAEPLEFDTAEVMRIRVVPIARQLVNPWSLAFLPPSTPLGTSPSTSLGTGSSDVTILVTEKEGRLRIIRNGVLDPKPIPGVPTVRVQGRSGLMEVLLHPQFATNRFVYFTYLKPVNEKQTALTVARGRFDGSAISELEDIFSCGPGVSGPSRLAWGRDGKLYMTTPSGGTRPDQERGLRVFQSEIAPSQDQLLEDLQIVLVLDVEADVSGSRSILDDFGRVAELGTQGAQIA